MRAIIALLLAGALAGCGAGGPPAAEARCAADQQAIREEHRAVREGLVFGEPAVAARAISRALGALHASERDC